MPGRRLLNGLTKLVIRGRLWVLIPILVVTAVLGSRIPDLEADPAPERLLASFEQDNGFLEAVEEFERSFGSTDRVMVLVLQADDVMSLENLRYLHKVSRHFRNEPWVERADSLTLLPLPRVRSEPPADEAPTLDDLDEDLFAEDGAGAEAEPEAADPEVIDALHTLVDAAPERFPGGFAELGARMEGQVATDPVIEGDTVEAEEATELREALQDAPLMIGRLVSEDRTVAAVALRLAGEDGDPEAVNQAVDKVASFLDEHPPPDGSAIHLGGLPYLRHNIIDSMRSDQLKLVPLTLLVCSFLLFVAFRWLPGVVLPIAAVVITTLIVVGGMAAAGEPMNVLNNIIAPLLIIIGISDSIHLVQRYREQLAEGEEQHQAGAHTVRSMAVACLLTSVTTAVGLSSLVVSKTGMLQRFGVTAAIGVMIAYVITITFLPSALMLARPPKPNRLHEPTRLESTIILLTQGVLRARWYLLGLTALLLGLAVWKASDVNVDHALLDQFSESDPIHGTTLLMEQKLEGIRPLEVSFTSSEADRFRDPEVLQALDDVQAWAEKRPEVIRALGPVDILQETYALVTGDSDVRTQPFESEPQVDALFTLLAQGDRDPLEAFVTEGGRRARLQVRLRDVGAQATLGFIEDLRGQMKRELQGVENVEFFFAGDAYTGSRGLEAVVHDLLGSLLTAVGIIFLLLAVLFRSLRLGLLSIPPNIIPLVFTMAYMVMRGIPLNAATVIIFSISLGLAVDGTIHVLARYREETLSGLGSSEALLRAARGTGQAIVVSSLTLMMGFAVLLFSSFVPVRHFGELIAVTVASSLIATMIVQPALLKVAGLPRRSELERASL
ncbi:MAG: efflux RND transporter permease subunit [Myxococcota bacterium]